MASGNNENVPAFNTDVPVKRNYRFFLSDQVINKWHSGGRLLTNFVNALSIFFPAGERMFVEAVRAHKNLIVPAAEEQKSKNLYKHPLAPKSSDILLEAVQGFIVQESLHGREHELYNKNIGNHYRTVYFMDQLVTLITTSVTNYLSIRSALSITLALEHWTGILAGSLLDCLHEGAFDEKCSENYVAIWYWHALEETEHKAVAFDVYDVCYPRSIYNHIRRCWSLIMTSFIFWFLVTSFFLILAISDLSIFSIPDWIELLNYLWFKPGTLRRAVVPFFHYFKFSFHPWEHDNRHHLKNFPSLTKTINSLSEKENS